MQIYIMYYYHQLHVFKNNIRIKYLFIKVKINISDHFVVFNTYDLYTSAEISRYNLRYNIT